MASTRATVEDKKIIVNCLNSFVSRIVKPFEKKVAVLQEDLRQFNLKGINVGIRRSCNM